MAKFQSGIGLLAENLNLPVIPMRLDGVAQMKQAHRRLARRNEITIHIGAPITFPRTHPSRRNHPPPRIRSFAVEGKLRER